MRGPELLKLRACRWCEMTSAVSPPPPQQMLLHYRVKGVIGAGGMGTVFEAEDTRLGRTVAIKLLHPGDSQDPESRERFLREARAAASIDHPNLCTVHAIEETPTGTLLLVMTLYRGQSLADLLKGGRLPVERIVSIGRQAAAGLHEAHMAGIVHRDIKPANLFLLSTGDLKILDFGLSRLGKQSHLTQPQQVLGTLAYMSPEQLAGGDLDHRTDVWALGAVLYEMATGHSPFQHPSSASMISLIGRAEYAQLARVRPELPSSLHAAVDGALRLQPYQRHGSAADLLKLLTACEATLNGASAANAVSTDETAFLPVQGHSRSSSASANQSRRGTTLAVLPLENMSSDPENEYFSDGLTDELITSLGKMSGLRVVSRASVFAFKGQKRNIQEIGAALSVGTVLEGSVRRSGSKVRVSVQLTDVQSGFQIWADRFDGEMRDVFDLQDELAKALVSALQEKLSSAVQMPSHIMMRISEHPEAYDAYLKGRYNWNQKTIEGVQLAGKYFEQALSIDPEFSLAHAGLADYYSVLGSLGMMSPHEAWPLARRSALHAISLAPELPEGHLALASVLQFYDWKWEEGRKEIERAIEMHPERGESYVPYVYHLMTQGLLEEALAQTTKGLKYDPLSTALLTGQALLRTYLGDHDTSILLAREALKTAPHHELYYTLGLACQASGRATEAVQALQQGLDESRMPHLLGWLADAHVKCGNHAEARAALNQLLEMAAKGMALPVAIAVAAAALDERALAFHWLEQAADDRDILVGYLTIMPCLQPLHEDERFRRLAERMNLRMPGGGT